VSALFTAKTVRAWEQAARKLGFDYHHAASGGPGSIRGSVGDLVLTIDVATKGRDLETRIEADGNGLIDRALTFCAPHRRQDFWKLFGGKDVTVDDRSFDNAVHANGPEALVLALMNRKARAGVKDLIARGGDVAAGKLRLALEGVLRNPQSLVEHGQFAQRLALKLVLSPKGVPPRLAVNAMHDPVRGVRRRNFEVLAARYPGHAETSRAAEHLLVTGDPVLKILAAEIRDGDLAFAALKAIAENRGADPGQRLRALEVMTRMDPYEKAAPAVAMALGAADERLRLAGVQRAGAARDAAMLERVCAAAAHAGLELARAVAQALGAMSDAKAESTLVELLRYDSPDVQAQAAEALGKVGTRNAIEPLLPLTRGLLASRRLKKAASAAIAAIQARLGEAEAGRVSLVEREEHAGAVSIAPGGVTGKGRA
jgi:hypothetical protein